MNRSSKTHQNISVNEAHKLLDIYGGEPGKWPAEYHDALIKAIADSPVLQNTQRELIQLDKVLAEHSDLELARSQPEQTAQLAAKIMRELPPQAATVTTSHGGKQRAQFTWPQLRAWWPAPAIAAVLAAIIVAGLPSEQTAPNNAQLAFEQWAWEDITAQNLVPDNGGEVDDEIDILIGLQQDG